MHILGTRQSIVKARCVKRTIPSERYDQQLLLQMKGTPYDTISPKIITVLTRYRPIVLELI